MSRGLGRCQRRVVELLEGAPELRMDRAELEEILVGEGFDASNILRAIRSLARRRYVIFEDGHRKQNSFVRFLKIEPVSEDWLFEVLAQIGDR